VLGRARWACRELATSVRDYPYVRCLRGHVTQAHPSLGVAGTPNWLKVCAVGQWVYEHAACGSAALLLDHDHLSTAGLFRALLADEGVVWCGGAARALQLLAAAFGFWAYALDLGARGLDSHTVTLIRIRHGTTHRLVVQDACFNQTYVDQDREPLDVFQLIDLLHVRNHEKVRLVQGSGEKPFLIALGDTWTEISGTAPELGLATGTQKHHFPATLDYFPETRRHARP